MTDVSAEERQLAAWRAAVIREAKMLGLTLVAFPPDDVPERHEDDAT